MTRPGLRLKAGCAADLTILSGMVQDALLIRSDMAYLPDDRRFVLAVNRFCWEAGAQSALRVSAGLVFDTVRRVRVQGLAKDGFLALLTIQWVDGEIRLDFSGRGAVALTVDRIDGHLEDFGEPWPTQWRPRHDLD